MRPADHGFAALLDAGRDLTAQDAQVLLEHLERLGIAPAREDPVRADRAAGFRHVAREPNRGGPEVCRRPLTRPEQHASCRRGRAGRV